MTALAAALALAAPREAGAQEDGLRVGVTLGGTGFVGLSFELLDDGRSVELDVGTWSFEDVTLSVVGRQYFGASAMKPVVGLGLWSVLSWPRNGQRGGASLVLRAPVGFDWRAAGGHFLAFDINVDRTLWVRHRDPMDDGPPSTRLVPFPGLAYRWQS